jgi:putative peptidoglycan lipid II flippase
MAVSFGAAIVVNLLLYREWGAFTLGAASSVCGLLMFLISAAWLGVLRFSLALLAVLLPGAAVAGVAGYALSGSGFLRLAGSCTAILLVWLGYVALVPSLRRQFLSGVLAKLRKKGPEAGNSADLEDTVVLSLDDTVVLNLDPGGQNTNASRR